MEEIDDIDLEVEAGTWWQTCGSCVGQFNTYQEHMAHNCADYNPTRWVKVSDVLPEYGRLVYVRRIDDKVEVHARRRNPVIEDLWKSQIVEWLDDNRPPTN